MIHHEPSICVLPWLSVRCAHRPCPSHPASRSLPRDISAHTKHDPRRPAVLARRRHPSPLGTHTAMVFRHANGKVEDGMWENDKLVGPASSASGHSISNDLAGLNINGFLNLFASMRFKGNKPLPEAEVKALQTALRAKGINLVLVAPSAGADIQAAVMSAIKRCDGFVAFGTKTWGQDTGNPGNSAFEVHTHAPRACTAATFLYSRLVLFSCRCLGLCLRLSY